MKNKLQADAAAYGISLLLNRAPAFFLLPFVTHQMTPTAVGIWVTALMVSDLLQAISNLGLRPAFFRYFSTGKLEEARLLFSTTLMGTILGGMVCGTLLWLFVRLREYFHLSPLFSGLSASLAIAVALVAGVGGLSNTFMLYFKVEQRASTFLKITICGFFWECFLAFVLYYFHLLTPINLLCLEGSKQIVVAFYSGYQCRKKWSFIFDYNSFTKLFAYGIWLIPTTFFTSLIFLSDRFWLGHLANLKTVGIYGLYYRLTMPLGILFSGYIASLDSQLFRLEKMEAKKFLEQAISSYLLWAGYVSVVVSWLLPLFIIQVNIHFNIFEDSYQNGIQYIPLFAIALYVFYFSDHFGSALEFAYRTRVRMFVLSGSAFLHFSLIWIGLSKAYLYSWDMGSIAIVITFFSFLVLTVWQAMLTRISIPIKNLFLFVGMCAACVGAAWFFAH